MSLGMGLAREREIRDAIEWAAVNRENGFRHLCAGTHNGNANGLFPVWNGVAINLTTSPATAGEE